MNQASNTMITGRYIEVLDKASHEAACKLVKGKYQYDLIHGGEAWSGATLRGKAKLYRSSYRKSRINFIRRLQSSGIKAKFITRAHGRIVLIIGEDK